MAVYSCWSVRAGGSRDVPSSVTLTHTHSTMSTHSTHGGWHYSSYELDMLSIQCQTKSHSSGRSWEASPHCDKRRYRLEILSTAPVLYQILWWRVEEKYFHASQGKWLCPPSPQDWTKHFSCCARDHTPVCRGLPQSDLSHRERRHTLHTVGNINSPARDNPPTLPPPPQH